MATELRPSLPIIDHAPEPYTGPPRDEVLAMRQQYLSPGVITYYREPLMIVEGHMQYVWDETGQRYLDAFAGIVTISVGHCHPKVVGEGPRADRSGCSTRRRSICTRRSAQLAEKLAEKMPAGLDAHLLHQLRQRGERNRHPLGPRVHRQPRRDRAPQRLPRRHAGRDGPHRPRHLEVQDRTTASNVHHTHARLLLPLPVRARVSVAAT